MLIATNEGLGPIDQYMPNIETLKTFQGDLGEL